MCSKEKNTRVQRCQISNKLCLVVYLPLWKMWVRQWEGWHPIHEMENNIHVPNHQPELINMNKPQLLSICYSNILGTIQSIQQPTDSSKETFAPLLGRPNHDCTGFSFRNSVCLAWPVKPLGREHFIGILGDEKTTLLGPVNDHLLINAKKASLGSKHKFDIVRHTHTQWMLNIKPMVLMRWACYGVLAMERTQWRFAKWQHFASSNIIKKCNEKNTYIIYPLVI